MKKDIDVESKETIKEEIQKVSKELYKEPNEVRLVKKKISVYNNNNIGNQFSNNFLNEIQLRYNKQENKFNNLSIPIKEKEKERDDLLLELKTIKENFLNLNYKES